MTRATFDEIPLTGGRTNAGIVRIGSSVHRPPRPNSEFVQTFLAHLHERGFDAAPKPLGRDEKGREVLSFIEGDVPSDLGIYDDDVLVAAAKLIRAYHDASSGFIPHFEIVCHNDLSPCNFVFREGKPVAIIDFDAAAPGSRVMDLGYVAWLWLNLGDEDVDGLQQQHRLQLFSSAYGEENVEKVVEAILLRQTMLIYEGKRLGNTGLLEWAQSCQEWTIKNLRKSYDS
jgi:aminoglycoside phosphotransferase (APT) family kinase protein